jgi:hypothetical protein
MMHRRVVMCVLAAVILVMAGCGGDETDSPQQPTAPPVTVETGGMVLQGDSAPDATSSAGAAATQDAATESVESVIEAPVRAVGATIVAGEKTSVFAEPAMQALRFAQYAEGSQFTVLETDGDAAAYPVVVDGVRWYRVRAEDGLVGWVTDPS